MLQGANTATVTDRHKALTCNLCDKFVIRLPLFTRRSDIEQYQLIYFFFIENTNRIDRITYILGILKLYSFNKTATLQ